MTVAHLTSEPPVAVPETAADLQAFGVGGLGVSGKGFELRAYRV